MAGNMLLNIATRAKKDEFYTQLSDIESELVNYKMYFEGKKVFCNCDDPFESNFFKYFVLNFNKLELKSLVVTSFAGSMVASTVFLPETTIHVCGNGLACPYMAEVNKVVDTEDIRTDRDIDYQSLFKHHENNLQKLRGDGDFRSQECAELLDGSDVS